MNKQLEDLASNCTKSQLAAKSPRKSELFSWPTWIPPVHVFILVFAGPFDGKYFLLLVDMYSKWPEIFLMSCITSDKTILKLQHIFNRIRIPVILISDDGTAFTSVKFSDFCLQNGIKCICTPPFHQNHGQVEQFEDTFKRALQKLKGKGMVTEKLEIFLTNYRTTPNINTPNSSSPAKALINCKIQLYM